MKIPSLSTLIHENRIYLILCLLFIILGGLLLIFIPKGELIVFFSNHRSPFWDFFFYYGTQLGEPLAYLVVIALLVFIRFRHALAVPLLGILVTLVAFVAKWIFYVDRPGAYFQQLGILDTIQLVANVRLNTGPTSFPSGHTMSAFALFTFLALCLPKKDVRVVFIFLLAAMIGISRVYLVQHFWQDIPSGALLGVLIALALYQAHWKWGAGKSNAWLDRRLGKSKA